MQRVFKNFLNQIFPSLSTFFMTGWTFGLALASSNLDCWLMIDGYPFKSIYMLTLSQTEGKKSMSTMRGHTLFYSLNHNCILLFTVFIGAVLHRVLTSNQDRTFANTVYGVHTNLSITMGCLRLQSQFMLIEFMPISFNISLRHAPRMTTLLPAQFTLMVFMRISNIISLCQSKIFIISFCPSMSTLLPTVIG